MNITGEMIARAMHRAMIADGFDPGATEEDFVADTSWKDKSQMIADELNKMLKEQS